MKRKIVYVVIAILIIGSAFSLCSCGYTGSETGAETESSYDEGYDDGYETGWDEGYEEGKQAAFEQMDEELESQNNDISQGEALPVSDAPAGMVFVTRTGDKYHERYCHYIDGKNDLTGYDSAQDAANTGYTPCSVCH